MHTPLWIVASYVVGLGWAAYLIWNLPNKAHWLHGERSTVTLRVIPDVGQPVLKSTLSPFLKGDEAIDILCGGCRALLAQGVSINTLKLTVSPGAGVQCPRCGALNGLN